MEYQFIVNPNTNRKVRIDTPLGKKIIKGYAQTGGAFGLGCATKACKYRCEATIKDLVDQSSNERIYNHRMRPDNKELFTSSCDAHCRNTYDTRAVPIKNCRDAVRVLVRKKQLAKQKELAKHKKPVVDDNQTMLANWSRKAKKVTLPKGTKLYGTYPTTCNELEARYDEETGKHGKYFSTGIYIPLGMILEYDNPANLCTFELLEDVECYVGKYSFRQLEADRFYKKYEDAPTKKGKKDKFVYDTDPIKSYNHFDDKVFPLHDLFDDNSLWDGTEGEVFLTAESLKKVRSVNNGEKISVGKAREMVEKKLKELVG